MRTSFILAAMVAGLTVSGGFGKGDVPNPCEVSKGDEAPVGSEDPRTKCEQNDCTAPAEWFPKTPRVEADFPKPDAVECDFYKWAWQSFLYLTQPEQDGDPPRFILFNTPNDLFDTSGGQKLHLLAAPTRDPSQKHILSLSVRNSPNTTRDIQCSKSV